MRTRRPTMWVRGLLLLAGAGAIAGCESKAGSGALIGGAAGAGIGGLIGSYSHARAGEGALIGGAVGAASGALVGNAMDQQERDEYRRNEARRYDDYPPEYRSYRYHRYDDDDYGPPPRERVEVYRETRYYRGY